LLTAARNLTHFLLVSAVSGIAVRTVLTKLDPKISVITTLQLLIFCYSCIYSVDCMESIKRLRLFWNCWHFV